MDTPAHAQRLLLVEDEALIAMAESSALSKHGYDVATAATGEEAVERVKSGEPFDLILMDINLGAGMNGTEAAEAILTARDVPLIFLSSHSEPEVVNRTEGITSYGYVVKTAGETVLTASIRMAFRLHDAKQRVLENERAIEEIDRRHQTALEALGVGVFSRDVKAGTLDLSPSWYRMLGYQPGDFPSAAAALNELLHPDDRARLREHVSTTAQKRDEPDSFEYRARAKDGSYRLIHGESRVVERAANGSIIRYAGTDTDVTDSRQTAEELETISGFLLRTEAIARSGSWKQNVASGIETWSPGEYELHGIDPAVQPDYELHLRTLHPDDRVPHDTVYKANLAGNETTFEQQFRIPAADGKIRHILCEYEIFRDADGTAREAIGVDKDITEQKRTTDALRESELRFRLAMDATSDGIFDLNLVTDEIYLSPGCFAMLGYGSDELPSTLETYQSLLHPDDAERSQNNLAAFLAGIKEDFSIEQRMRTKSGEWLWVYSRGKVVERDETGVPARLVGTNVNIDKAKRASEELAEERALAAEYLRVAEVMLITLDPQMRVTAINERGCEILGLSEWEIVGSDWCSRFVLRADSESVSTVFSKIVNGKANEVEYNENAVVCGDGSRRIVSWHNAELRDRRGQRTGIICSGADVTEQRAQEAELFLTKERYRLLFESTGIGVGYYNTDGTIIQFNNQALASIGKKEQEVVGKTLFDLFPADDAREYLGRIKATVAANHTLEFEDTVVLGDRSARFLSVCSCVHDRDGTVAGVQIAATDITEQHDAQRAVEAALRERQTMLRELQHRAKNSFSTLLNLLELSRKEETTGHSHAVLEQFRVRVQAVSHLYDLLCESEAEAEIRLDGYLNRVTDTFRESYKELNVRTVFDAVTVTVETAIPVGIIVTELLTNSVKHVAQIVKNANAEVAMKSSAGTVTITVTDSGPGFPPDFDLATSRSLGLTLIDMLSRQIAGTFRVERGSSARCIVTFPCKRVAEEPDR